MEFGLMVEPQLGGSYEDLTGLARWAEDRGLAVFARSDHYTLPGRHPEAVDALASLAGIARETERINLCVLVSPITFRHPAVLAKTAATIDQMSAGRMMLGVGTGWMEAEHEVFGFDLWPLKERFARLEETLQYLRAAFSDGEAAFQGRYYSLQGIDVRPKPAHLPIVVGGSGARKTPILAGRYADEFNRFVDTPRATAAAIEVMRREAKAAGRDPNRIIVSAMGPLPVFPTRDGYSRDLDSVAADRDSNPADVEERRMQRGVPRGTPDEAQETLDGLAAVGVQRYYVQHFEPLSAIDTGRLDAALTLLGA
ncbi:MAG: LLM class flavin-dependent oxidoreductase [Acidimicrobiia bacterium]